MQVRPLKATDLFKKSKIGIYKCYVHVFLVAIEKKEWLGRIISFSCIKFRNYKNLVIRQV